MPFELPNDCDSLKPPKLPDFQKSIVDAVMNGDAFQNPFGGVLGGVGDMLSGAGGIGESLTGLIDAGGLPADVTAMLEGLQESLGFNVPGSGILGTLSEFKGHMDMMSGVGNLSDFSERLGIGTALDGAKQELGLGAGGFGDMFSSFENGGAMLDGIGSQLGSLKDMLSEAVGGVGDINIDAMGALSAGILTFGDDIMGQINLDNNAFSDAKGMLQKIGIAKMVTTDTNCYVNKLLTGMIGKSDVVSALPKALAEKAGPALTETEKIAVEQSKKAKIEEVKAKGIKSTKAAELIGKSQTDKPEEIEKVKSRPVYEDLVSGKFWKEKVIEEGWDYIPMGEPMWDENVHFNSPEDGAWIQWIQNLSIVEKIIQVDENGVSNITDSDLDESVMHNEMLPLSSDTAEDLAFARGAGWPQGLKDVSYTSIVKPLVWSTNHKSWWWYNLSPHTVINPSVFGSKWLLSPNNRSRSIWNVFEYGDKEETAKSLLVDPWKPGSDNKTIGWRASGYIIAQTIYGKLNIKLLNPNV
jgi:hypothetical protein